MSHEHRVLEQSSVAGVIAALLAVILLAWLAARPLPLPEAAHSRARPSVFSAGRALAHMQVLAHTPRPIASAANARARDYIAEKLRAIGLQPEVQVATVQRTTRAGDSVNVTVGVVHNIVVRKRGSGPAGAPALLMSAHYDSAFDALGAADGGAPVAALLEMLRALQQGPNTRNDLIVLFADGEEAGSLGTRGFAAQHRFAREVGLVLDFDGAGRGGPLVLRDASGGNGKAVAIWARAAPLSVGSSHLTADSGTPLRSLGVPALRFANLEGRAGEAGMLDSPERYDPRTLQHSGDTMLALARAFGDEPLAGLAAADRVFFNVGPLGVVHYDGGQVWYLTRLACLVFIVVAWGVVWRGAMRPRQLAWGALAYVAKAGVAPPAAWLLWRHFPGSHSAWRPLAVGAGEHDHWYLLAAAAMGSAIFTWLQRRLQAAIGLAAAVLGAMLVLLVLLLAASAFAPGAAYLLAWPLTGALLAFGALYVPRVAALPYGARLAILVAGLAPAVVLIAPLARQLDWPMAALALLLGLGTTLLAATHRRFVVPGLLAASAGCMTLANAQPPYAGEAARINRMTYLKDAQSWKSYWLLPDAKLDGYSRRFFPAERKRRAPPDVAGIARALWVAEAPRTGVALPAVQMLSNVSDGAARRIAFVLQSKNAAPTIEVRLDGPALTQASLNGASVTDGAAAAHWTLTLHGMGTRPLDFRVTVDTAYAARIDVMEKMQGLPDGAAGKRPPGRHNLLAEQTLATDTLVFR